jgi:lipopolysaccharide export system protein LptA
MTRLIQFSLLIFLMVLIYFFYIKFFNSDNFVQIDSDIPESLNSNENLNLNIIKNLKYEINTKENNRYSLISKSSEIVNENGEEIVNMKQVNGKYTFQNGTFVIITSDEAIYNNYNYNTHFKKKVKLRYLENVLYADNIILDFKQNKIKIYDNVVYKNSSQNLNADNVDINLITKKIDIFMSNNSDAIKINSKK